MYFDEEQLIGYIGINSYGAPDSEIEVNGMVKPEYRNQGVFKTLFELVIAEWKRRNASNMLLLSDRKSNSGQKFIKGTGAQYKYSEYEMYFNDDKWDQLRKQLSGITLRKATNADTYEINKLDAICFDYEGDDIKNNQNGNTADNISVEADTSIKNESMIIPEEEKMVPRAGHNHLRDHLFFGEFPSRENSPSESNFLERRPERKGRRFFVDLWRKILICLNIY